jgi:hypothetical protein
MLKVQRLPSPPSLRPNAISGKWNDKAVDRLDFQSELRAEAGEAN